MIIEILGRRPTSQEIDSLGKYPYRYYKQKFGGIKKSFYALADRVANNAL
jgi:hypothetical protein